MKIDLESLLNTVNIGARRSSAFIAIGFSAKIDFDSGADFSLGGVIRHEFWPSPVPKEAAKEAMEEFRSWLICSSLKEIHLFFDLFLNQYWNILRAVSKFGTKVPLDFVWMDAGFADITSVSKKLTKVGEVIPLDPAWDAAIRSFHQMRNCLAHGAGHVRKRDLTEDDKLVLKWSGMKVYLEDQGKRMDIEDAIRTGYVAGEGGARVVMEVKTIEKEFGLGDKLNLSQEELGEIIHFYVSVAKTLVARLLDFLRARGVPILAAR